MSEERACVFVTTPRGLEYVAAQRIAEMGYRAVAKPEGMEGIVIVYCTGDPEEAAERVSSEVVEAERVLPVYRVVEASLDAICEAASGLARMLRPGETFAVRTTRRGRHTFTSIDVNVRAGACIQEVTGNPVDLTYPDKVFWVEIVGGRAYLSVTPGNMLHRKKYPGKPDALRIFSKTLVVQTPYLGDMEGARKIGVRLGRAFQTFEVREVVIAPYKPADIEELDAFLSGLIEGRASRVRIQKRTYARRVKPVPIRLYDLYQHVRAARQRGDAIIVTSTKGRYIGEVADSLAKLYEEHKRVHVLIGSREGIPVGIYRFADLVVDVAPGLTLATDTAATAILVAITNAVISSQRGET